MARLVGFGLLVLTMGLGSLPVAAADKPNVIILLTDDQGYADFGCHGHPLLKTPHMDRLASQSIRFTDFHVAPMCTPTRGQLMTGLDGLRNGATAVCAGRALVRPGIPFLSEAFKAAGYKNGLFGKWHLGETYPHRPQDRGFEEFVYHQGWGITSIDDRWNNDYFDGTFLHNGKPKPFPGYCTDVFFTQAMTWMKTQADKDQPFFCYLPTNAPHGPHWCPDADRAPYLGKTPNRQMASFFGMIANIDHNVGKLLAFLEEQNLDENTIVILMNDNGGTAGVKFYNAGMRGSKTTYYEGGHRAACFIRWPAGQTEKLGPPRDIPHLTHVQDIFPTLIDWCGLPRLDGPAFDGRSLTGMLTARDEGYVDNRKLVVQFGESPGGSVLAKSNACVLWNDGGHKWRLVHGKELYDVQADLAQTKNLIDQHPDVAKELRDHYEQWWAVVGPNADDFMPIVIGSPEQNPVPFTSTDWSGVYADNAPRDVRGGLKKNGPWHLQVAQPGEYEVELRRWPREADVAMDAGVPAFQAKDGMLPAGKALPVASARLKIGDFDQTLPVPAGAKSATFTVTLQPTAKVPMQTWLRDASGNDLCGAYYAYIRKK